MCKISRYDYVDENEQADDFMDAFHLCRCGGAAGVNAIPSATMRKILPLAGCLVTWLPHVASEPAKIIIRGRTPFKWLLNFTLIQIRESYARAVRVHCDLIEEHVKDAWCFEKYIGTIMTRRLKCQWMSWRFSRRSARNTQYYALILLTKRCHLSTSFN